MMRGELCASRRLTAVLALTAACVATTGYAADKATKCVAVKLAAAGKYAACRLQADAKAAKSGGVADYAKCDTKFVKAFDRAEAKAGAGICPRENNATGVGACLERVTSECTPLVSGCDGTADCGACQQCAQAEGGPCSDEAIACAAEPECSALNDCLNQCAGDPTCVDQCVSSYPAGFVVLQALASCVICETCPIDCDGPGAGCS